MEKLKFVSHPSFSLRFWICPPPPLNKGLYLEYTSVICSIFFSLEHVDRHVSSY